MRPIPVAFHLWFLELHTYGIGLALTFWFGLRYTERRLRQVGYPWKWVTGMFVWVIVAAIVGARALHVVSNLSFYSHNPGQVLAVWQGGLSSFGGIIFAVPVAIVSTRRRCPQLPSLRFADLMAPVLMACWGIGRLLGPQLMVAGGGHPTNQWFGMYYAGQVGKRLPVPIFQSIEDFTIFGILLLVERWLRTIDPAAIEPAGGVVPQPRLSSPSGIVLGVGMVLWGIERFLDEHLWLGEDGHLGSLLVQFAGIALVIAGIALLISRFGRLQRWRRGEADDSAPGDGVAAAATVSTSSAATVSTSSVVAGDPPVGTSASDEEGVPSGSEGRGSGTPAPVPSVSGPGPSKETGGQHWTTSY